MRYKKVVAGLLAICLIVNIVPTTVMAETLSQGTDTTQEYTDESSENNQTQTTEPDAGDNSAEDNNVNNDNADNNSAEDNNVNNDNADNNSADQSDTETNETGSNERTETEVPENTAQEGDSDVSVTATDGKFTLEQLKQANISGLTISDDNTKVTASSVEALILLSHCTAAEQQNLIIDINITGIEVDLTTTTTGPDGQQYTFAGFGSEEVPFSGQITGQKPVIKANRAIFSGLSSSATVISGQQINWTGDGSSPMLADVYVLTGGAEAGIPMAFLNGTGAIVGKVKGDGTFKIGNQITYSSMVSINGNNHAGLLCNILESGSVQITNDYEFPTEGYTISATAGNAGGLIGQMNEGTQLIVDKAGINLTALSVNATAGNAGGLIAQMDAGAQIVVNQAIVLDKPSVTASVNAGGFIGQATNVLFAETNQKITLTSPTVTATAGGTVGGIIGRYELSGKGNQTFPTCIDITDPVLQINQASNGNGYIGGYFGVLSLKNGTDYTIGDKTEAITLHITMNNSNYIRAYGAVAGCVQGDLNNGVLNALYLKKLKITSDYYGTKRSQARYHGGVIGELGATGNSNAAVYLEADTIEVEDTNPYAYNDNDPYATIDRCAFGGIVGLSAKGSVSKIRNIQINTGTGEISKGGGSVGFAEAGSAVELSGTTDFSKVRYAKYWSAGQIVGGQDSALIYARGDGEENGWILERCLSNYASQNNDIGNYGHVIRLKAEGTTTGLSSTLIGINDATHQINLASPSDTNFLDGALITNTDDFALLNIAWSTHGAFPVAGVTAANYTNLQTQTITLDGDVDLTGTGITGVSRDSQQDEMEYSGTINGQNHTIKLALGETFGLRNGNKIAKGAEGGGKLYPYKWGSYYNHTAIGMFAQARGNVNQLTVAGQITMSNVSDFSCVGGFAAKAKGSTVFSGVKIEEKITIDAPNTKKTYIGGVFGEATDSSGGNIEVTFQNNSIVKPDITIQELNSNSDSYINAGSIIGYGSNQFHKLACNGLTVGGTIEANGSNYNYAYVGGLIARAAQGGLARIEIQNLSYEGFKIDAPEAQKVCGGLFGSIWANVGVFMGLNDNSDETFTGTKLTVTDATINAPKANVGGLVYRSSGRWEIRKKGIDMQKFVVNAGKDVGLLVCHGERGREILEKADTEIAALYLTTTTYWKDENDYSYKIGENVSVNCAGVYDEFVAYTAASADAITTNNVNGIISIATKNREGVAESENKCTTYENRTEFGKQHKTNACSRYYYDLDQCYKDAYNNMNGRIDTQSELMLWGAYQYADKSLKNYFIYDNGETTLRNDATSTIIGGESENGLAVLDMRKYSYYPVNLGVSGMTVQNVTIKFYNEDIEKAESNNKSTKKTANSQHYTMHCGLFLNYTNLNDSDKKEYTINVNNVKFQGTIGKTALGSGVIFGGNVEGSSVNGILYPITMNLNNVTLDGFSVYDCGESYAPLLINQLSNYTTLTATGIKATSEYEKNTEKKSASSLIGNVGSENGNQINMTFSEIALPDKTVVNGGIFTHATLLESFQYAADGIAVATYNFTKSEDWNGTDHIHKVTYGKEISASEEYAELQLWYFDEEGYGIAKENGGNVVYSDENKNTDFSSYLPYVCNKHVNTQGYAHEIRVNQRPVSITTGCGTYGDPYKITSEKQMKHIAEYLATRNAQKDWAIRVTTDQSTMCTGENNHDEVYQYDGKGSWVSVSDKTTTLSNTVMHLYMLSAYYDIQGNKETTTGIFGTQTLEKETSNTGKTLTLTDFQGFGSEAYPFRGVITCTDKNNPTTIILKGSGTGNGLIPYSYGSVVKDINVSYQNDKQLGITKSISYTANSTSDYYSATFFGGVIGSIMGGDNIIDNVSVDMSTNWLGLSGNRSYLAQIGGYVGSIVGGGVIFRNMDGKTGLTTTQVSGANPASTSTANLYVNPYVGRVLDGYAFSEGCTVENTNKNYKINELSVQNDKCITTTGESTSKVNRTNPMQTEVKDAQGLLVLSAIVNSGAAAGGDTAGTGTYGTNAYSGNIDASDANGKYRFGNGVYGKVRNASYSHIGENCTSAEGDIINDFALSVSDDRNSPGYNAAGQEAQMASTLDKATNAPYLVTKYANPATFYIGGNARSTSIVLSQKGTYDMSGYGTGYQGISARYRSYALYSSIVKYPLSERVVPWITNVDGKNSILKVNMPVLEYSDDDFHAASIGGLFNVLRQVPDEVPADQQETYHMLQNLTIGSNNSTEKSVITLSYVGVSLSGFGNNNQYNVGVGGFAGSTAGVSAGVKQVSTANVRCKEVKLQNLDINSPASAGGLFGNTGRGAGANTDIGILIGQSSNSYNNYFGLNLIDCTYDRLNITGKYASGGFAGYVDSGANELISSVKNTTGAELEIGVSSTITASTGTSYAGGIFGSVKTNLEINNTGDESSYKNVIVKGTTISATTNAGGYVGQVENSNNATYYNINNAVFKDGNVTANSNIGGLIGNSESKQNNSINKCNIENSQLNTENGYRQAGGLIGRIGNGQIGITHSKVQGLTVYGKFSGGLIGEIIGTVTIEDTEITGTESKKNRINSTDGASGIYGRLSTNNPIIMKRCQVKYTEITTTQWSASAFSGDIHVSSGKNASISIYDSSAQHIKITAPFSGGMAGQMRGSLTAANIVMNDVEIIGKQNNNGLSGTIISDPGSGAKYIYVAGISMQNINMKDKNGKVADNLYGYTSEASKEAIGKKCYFAFADYTGTSLKKEGTVLQPGTETDNLLDVTGTSPYAVTSPKSTLKVEKNGKEQFLYGDGAAWTKSGNVFNVNAQTIVNEKENSTNGHFSYKNTGVATFDFEAAFSTYNENQKKEKSTNSNFPVLRISGGDVTAISSYLDILTNGGFSAANALNTSTTKHVVVSADVYSYKDANTFIYDAAQSSALRVTTDKNGQISFSATTDYDNDKNRFILLTATFAENGHSYNLQVPVLVRRMLEVDFTATLTHGTHFKSSEYDGLTSHVLDSYDSTITGYITYVYNSAMKKYTDYGWQSYVDAGGDIGQIMDKHIICNLPAGTHLSLVDCQDNNKTVYYHDITDDEAQNREVLLSNFVNTSGMKFIQKSIGELLGAKVEKSVAGKFIKVDENGKPDGGKDDQTYPAPTVRIKGKDGYEYYRLAGTGETGAYNVMIDEDALKSGTTSNVSENYYLVITVPSTSTNETFINGGIDTNLNISVPKHINCLLRDNKAEATLDPKYNSASTYQISKGYEQELTESLGDDVGPIKLISVLDSKLQVSIKDKITFPNGQAYLTTDQLYQKFTSSIQVNHNVNGTLDTSTSSFPSGTSGTVHYYVYTENDGNRTYYSYDGKAWSDGSYDKQEVTNGGYVWTSDGGNMELVLSTDGTMENAISLEGVRNKIKGTDNTASTTFYIEAIMEVTLPTAGLDVIPESKLAGNAPENYAKLMYTSLVSTEKDSLSYSNNRASLSANKTKVSYYRDEPEGVKLTYDADYIDQLGINLLDLGQNVDVDKNYANIDTTALYDLSSMKNLKETLLKSNGVRFTIKVLPKNTTGTLEEYGDVLEDASKYLTVEVNSPGYENFTESKGTWSWNIPKKVYVDNAENPTELKNSNIFDGSIFTQAIRLKVNVKNVENMNHFYSNYKVLLSAEILNSNDTTIEGTYKNDNIIYTITKIKTEFVDETSN